MVWCSKCGVSGDKEPLYEAISDKGIVKVCKKCVIHEDWPIIKKPADLTPKRPAPQLAISRDGPVKMGVQSKAMFDRLTRLSGVIMSEKKEESKETIRQNSVLREMANRNFESKIIKEKADTSELIPNFNWAIMRARRATRLSQGQLAEAIGESEAAIRRAEQGVLPGGGIGLVRKIESYLKIHLFKTNSPSQTIPKELEFDPVTSRNLRISDLKGMKKDENASVENPENKIEEKELSDEDVDNILFGR